MPTEKRSNRHGIARLGQQQDQLGKKWKSAVVLIA
jgi:hypothetical protein